MPYIFKYISSLNLLSHTFIFLKSSLSFINRPAMKKQTEEETHTEIDTTPKLSGNPSVLWLFGSKVTSYPCDLGNSSSNSADVDDDSKGQTSSNSTDVDEDVDTTLTLCFCYSRNSDNVPPVASKKISVPFKMFDNSDDKDGVNTRLTLGLPGMGKYDVVDKKRKRKRKRRKVKAGEDDEHQNHLPSLPMEEIPEFLNRKQVEALRGIQENPTDIDKTLKLSLPNPVSRNPSDSCDLGYTSSNSTDDDDDCMKDVDTTLRLSISDSRKSDNILLVARNQIAVPFRMFDNADEDEEVDTRLTLGLTGMGKDYADNKKKRRRGDDENQRPSRPIEEIPELFRALRSRGGSESVFLYRKKLTESDVNKEQQRMFVTRDERVKRFLREEEAAVVYGKGKGMKMVGVDGRGEVFQKMGLTKYESLKMLVINSDWSKMTEQNQAKKGDVVEVWGYRENEKPCLAINFIHVRIWNHTG